MQLYNTLTKQLEETPHREGEPLRMYTCGPTVHNYAHIGNLRTYVMADLLYRTLRASGQEVDYAMNITDVDDKTILATIAEYGQEATVVDLHRYTNQYLELFLADLRKVHVEVDSIRITRVSEVIPQIQEFVMQLVEKGYAYKTEDGVYFSIEKYQSDYGDYGVLVGEKFLEGKKVSIRIANDEYDKENLSDFALWKSHSEQDGNIFWDHPALGKGRPGWHIECSVINRVSFGTHPTDIHTGAVDLIFPHHTNEIAQSQPLGPFVYHWMHAEHLMVDNKKMAKSDHNFYTLHDIEAKGFNGTDLRYSYLQSHYKSQQNFTWDALQASHNAVQKLRTLVSDEITPANDHFLTVLNQDLNTAQALAVVWEDKHNVKAYDNVLGLNLQPMKVNTIPDEIQKLVDQRQQYRNEKNFAKSDELRVMIEKLGYDISDTPAGQTVVKKNKPL